MKTLKKYCYLCHIRISILNYTNLWQRIKLSTECLVYKLSLIFFSLTTAYFKDLPPILYYRIWYLHKGKWSDNHILSLFWTVLFNLLVDKNKVIHLSSKSKTLDHIFVSPFYIPSRKIQLTFKTFRYYYGEI